MPRFGTNPIATGRDEVELLDIPTWDMVKATASETLRTSPTPSMWRSGALEMAEEGVKQDSYTIGKLGYVPSMNRAPASPLLSKSEADAKIEAAGLTGHLSIPDTGVRSSALDILLENKTQELRNRFLLDRYEGGIAGGAVQLSTALATSLADPINVASAFVPVVGEARYAQLLGRAGTTLGRAGVRGSVGAIEGTVGAAMLEPLIYQSQQQLQSDYTSYDSLVNVGFGAVLGGALHPAAGTIGDVLAKRAGLGGWAETTTFDGNRVVPELGPQWVQGGGTQFIDGGDYVRGQYAAIEASQLTGGESFGAPDLAQLGESPWADNGAPVVTAEGQVTAGRRRAGTILDAYARGEGTPYRDAVVADGVRLGFGPDALTAMESPVLVRVEASREKGAWDAFQRDLSPPGQRTAFESPDALAAREFRAKAQSLGVSEEASAALSPTVARDEVTGFYDGRQAGMKSATVERALEHIERTGEPGVYVSADISNLGGLNAAMGNRAESANVHFRALSDILDRELLRTGADVVSMRTGGDELGSVVVNADVETVSAALDRAEVAVREYVERSGLAEIPHPKRKDSFGVGLHFGMAELRPGERLTDIFNRADDGVDFSKNGGENGRAAQVEAFRASRAGAGAQRPGEAARGTQAQDGAVRPQAREAALKVGVSQVVNGDRLNPQPASLLDGTAGSVERFLESKRIADEAVAQDIQARSQRAQDLARDLERFDDAGKVDQELTALESRLRDEIRASGGDESALDQALEAVRELEAEAQVESKAYRGVALCMMRGG